jgi:inorganic triphosphatase YgiF
VPQGSEIELKFQVPAASAAAVRRAVATPTAQRTRMQAVYADTADGRLAAAGLALRLRREGERWVQTLKGRGDDLMHRLEHELALPAGHGEPQLDPTRHAGTAAGQALAAVLQGAELLPQYRTDIQRLHRVLRHAGSQVEIAFDEGCILAGERSLPVCELEFELKAGSPAALVELASRWALRHGLWLDVRTKSERGHRLARCLDRVPPVRAAALPAVSLSDRQGCFKAMLVSTLAHALPNAAEIAEGIGAPEHLHQLRVALRRLRTALRMFADWSPDPAAAMALEAAWRPCFQQLGEVRDVDAVEAAFGPALAAAGAPPKSASMPAVESDDPGALLRDPVFTQQVLATLRLVHNTPPPWQAAEPELRDAAAEVLRQAWRAVHRDSKGFAQASIEIQHRLRRRVKRLRYACEFLQSLFPGRPTERALKAMRSALEALGHWNDLQVARALCQARDADAHAWFALGWLAARQPAQLERCVEALEALDRAPRFWRGRR